MYSGNALRIVRHREVTDAIRKDDNSLIGTTLLSFELQLPFE